MTTRQIAQCEALRQVFRKVVEQAERHERKAREAEAIGSLAVARTEWLVARTCRDSAARYLAELRALKGDDVLPLFPSTQPTDQAAA